MTTKRVKLSDALKKKGKTREELVENMSEDEIRRRADSDPDNPSLTDEQLKEFSVASKRERDNDKS